MKDLNRFAVFYYLSLGFLVILRMSGKPKTHSVLKKWLKSSDIVIVRTQLLQLSFLNTGFLKQSCLLKT